MSSIVVAGGLRLRGEVRPQGSGLGALQLLGAALLGDGKSVLGQVPRTGEVAVLRSILGSLGVRCDGDRAVEVHAEGLSGCAVSYEAARRLPRAALLLGPLVARHGEARMPLPGATAVGAERLDVCLRSLEAMGARVRVERGDAIVRARRLQGATLRLPEPSVTVTSTLLLAAALARGRTRIQNAAREPEVEELALVLNKMGAAVTGGGTSELTVDGTERLEPYEHTLPPDRVEAGFFVIAAASTRGDVRITGIAPDALDGLVGRLQAMGVTIEGEAGGVVVRGPEVLAPLDVGTAPYPGVPSELGPALVVLATRATGQSLVTEGVHDARLRDAAELTRLDADVAVDGRMATIRGPARLKGARVRATEARGAAALCLAGLCAEGETTIDGLIDGDGDGDGGEAGALLDEAFEDLPARLRALGANVTRASG